jgi:hypothetical protein
MNMKDLDVRAVKARNQNRSRMGFIKGGTPFPRVMRVV